MNNEQLEVLVMRLKSGEYDGVHIMQARLAAKELIEIRAERAALTLQPCWGGRGERK